MFTVEDKARVLLTGVVYDFNIVTKVWTSLLIYLFLNWSHHLFIVFKPSESCIENIKQ